MSGSRSLLLAGDLVSVAAFLCSVLWALCRKSIAAIHCVWAIFGSHLWPGPPAEASLRSDLCGGISARARGEPSRTTSHCRRRPRAAAGACVGVRRQWSHAVPRLPFALARSMVSVHGWRVTGVRRRSYKICPWSFSRRFDDATPSDPAAESQTSSSYRGHACCTRTGRYPQDLEALRYSAVHGRRSHSNSSTTRVQCAHLLKTAHLPSCVVLPSFLSRALPT